jgi:hypothetical protein
VIFFAMQCWFEKRKLNKRSPKSPKEPINNVTELFSEES